MKITRKSWFGRLAWNLTLATGVTLSFAAEIRAQYPEYDPQAGSARISGGNPYQDYRVEQAQYPGSGGGYAGYAGIAPSPAYGAGYVPPQGVVVDPAFRAAAGLGGPSLAELDRIRFQLYHSNGDINGVDRGFTNIGAFIPRRVFSDYNLFAINPRLLMDNNGNAGFNLGAVHRFYMPEYDRMFGNSFWWDFSRSYGDEIQGVGYSFETVGRYFSFRLNANFRLGESQKIFAQQILDPALIGNFIALPVIESFEAPLNNVLAEVAAPAPYLGKYGVELGLAGYVLTGSGVDDTIGVRGRVQWQMTEDLSFNTMVSNDNLFDTNVQFNVEWLLPTGLMPSRIARPNPVVMSLVQSVQRDYQVKVARGQRTKYFNEINPKDNAPFLVAIIDPDAAAGGNGTSTSPFGSVAEYMATDPAARSQFDIIFVQPRNDGSSTNLSTGITITDTQRLLGNGTRPDGLLHTYTSARGTFFLPGQETGAQPLLSNLGMAGVEPAVITIAGNATEISNFGINAANGGLGIASSGAIDGFNINNNAIVNARNGIRITSNTSAFLNCPGEDLAIIHNNSINGIGFGALRGVDLTHVGGTLGLSITDNTVSGFLGEDRDNDGVIFPTEDGNGNGILDPGEDRNGNNQLDGTEDLNGNGVLDQGAGIDVEVTGGTVVGTPSTALPTPLGIINNEVSQTGTGIQFTTNVGTTSTLDVVDNNSHDNQQHGMSFSADGGTLLFSNFSGNTAQTNGLDGNQWIATNGGVLRTLRPATGNIFNGNRRNGMLIQATNAGQMFFQLGDPNDADPATFDNQFNSNGTAGVGGDGIQIVFNSGAQLIPVSGIYNAQVTSNQGRGIVLDLNDPNPGATVFNNFQIIASDISQSGGDGILVSARDLNLNGAAAGRGLRDLQIINNNISLNLLNGINFQLLNSDLVNHVILGNTINQNAAGNAGPVGPSQYTVDVVFGGGLTPSQQAIFALAAARWSQIIIGDVPDVGAIDDIEIFAQGAAIDGVGGILGQAGPTQFRAGTFLPYQGIMQFDSADLANLESSGQLVDVILHEMGHVIGSGTIWNNLGLLTGAGGADPRFTGTAATTEFNARFGTAVPDVPVENTGGPGTRDSHWRESVFNNELMTGFLNAGVNPISRITIGQWEDLGYQVNYLAADPYLTSAANLGTTVDFETQFLHDVSGLSIPVGGTPASALTLPTSNLVTVNANATGNGINYSNANSAIINGVVEDNTITQNGNHGVAIENPQFGGVPSDILFLTNTISQNAASGVEIVMGDANVLTANVRGNTFAGNGSFGFHAAANETAIFNFTFGGPLAVDGNTFTGNGDANLAIELSQNANIPTELLIQNNSFNGAVDAANVDFAGEGISLRASGNAFYRDVKVISNNFNANASDGFRVDITEFAQFHAAGNPFAGGLLMRGNLLTANLNGIGIHRDADAVFFGQIGIATAPVPDRFAGVALGNTVANNTQHGLFVETRGSDLGLSNATAASLGVNLTVANNLFQANAVDNVHVEMFDLSTANVGLICNTIDGAGVSQDGVDISTNNSASFIGDIAFNPVFFDGNSVFDHTDSGYEFNLNSIAVLNNNNIQNVAIRGILKPGAAARTPARIERNLNGVVVNHSHTGNSQITIGDAATVNPGNPLGSDQAPDAPDVIIANNTNDAIQHNHLSTGVAVLNVNNTLALGNRTLGGASRDGLHSLVTQSSGTTVINVDHSTFTDFGNDGMNFFYDSANNRLTQAAAQAINQDPFSGTVLVNVTNTVTGQSQFSRNVGDGVEIELWDSGATFAFNNHQSFNNGGDGLRFTTFGEDISGSRPVVLPDIDNSNPADQTETTSNQNPGLLARGDYFTDFPFIAQPAGPNPFINNNAAVYGDVNSIDVIAGLTILNSNYRFNGDDGIELAIGAATLQSVIVRNTQMFANAVTDFRTHTITNEVSFKQDSINRGDVAPPANRTDEVALDPLAHLYLNFGDAGLANSGNQINPIGYRTGGGLSGVFTNNDSIRGVNRVIGINFNVFTNATNLFTVSGSALTTFGSVYDFRSNLRDNDQDTITGANPTVGGDNPEAPPEAGAVNTP